MINCSPVNPVSKPARNLSAGLSDAAAGAAGEPAPAAQTAGDDAPAAPAADAAAPHPQHSSGGSGAQVTWRSLLLGAVGKLGTNLWPLLLVHLVCDVLVWVLHRLSHRLTNEGVHVCGGGLGVGGAAGEAGCRVRWQVGQLPTGQPEPPAH